MQSHSTGRWIMNDELLEMSKSWKDLPRTSEEYYKKKCQNSQSYDTNHINFKTWRSSADHYTVTFILLLQNPLTLSALQTHPHADSLEAAIPYHQMSLLQGPASRWGVLCRAAEALHNTSSYLFISQTFNKCRANITFANTVQRKLNTRENIWT